MMDRSPISGTPIQPDTFRDLSNVRRERPLGQHPRSSACPFAPMYRPRPIATLLHLMRRTAPPTQRRSAPQRSSRTWASEGSSSNSSSGGGGGVPASGRPPSPPHLAPPACSKALTFLAKSNNNNKAHGRLWALLSPCPARTLILHCIASARHARWLCLRQRDGVGADGRPENPTHADKQPVLAVQRNCRAPPLDHPWVMSLGVAS